MLKWAAPATLLVAFFLQSFLSSRIKSATFDEPAHIAAGLSYVSTGVFHANPQHPPLMKELSGLSLLIGGVRWPDAPNARDIIAHPPEGKTTGRDWEAGKEIFAAYGIGRVLLLARFPMILTGVFLGLMIYFWGREMLGEPAALGALFLYAFDPTLIAHSALVTTDVGFAAFTVAFFYALWKYAQSPTLAGQVWCGVALGCALGAKYSAVFLLPIAAVLLVLAARKRNPRGPDAPNLAAAKAFGVMCAVALVLIELFYGFRASPLAYADGLLRVNADHDPNYLAVLAGDAQKHFYHYFAVAYLLKEPLASIALAVGGTLLLLRRKAAAGWKPFLFLPPVVLFAVHSLWAANLGIRYIIPVLPFAWLAGGAALAWLVSQTAAWPRVLAVGLCAWTLAAAAGIYPDHLSYFNEFACLPDDTSRLGFDGGSRCGPMWLDDANVDWGQSMWQLKAWLDANAKGRPVHIMPFASVPPETYGIQYTPPPPAPTGTPALYVISGHFVARLGLTDRQIRNARPLAIVGHAFYIYEF